VPSKAYFVVGNQEFEVREVTRVPQYSRHVSNKLPRIPPKSDELSDAFEGRYHATPELANAVGLWTKHGRASSRDIVVRWVDEEDEE
jgi:hypothetical protein